MPNRIIRSGILSSEKVNALSLESEVFYRRLMSFVDDYGRCEAHPAMLRAALYPLRIERVKEAAIIRMLDETVKVGLVKCYASGGKNYLEITKFDQQKRSASKCPGPESADSDSQKAPVSSTCVADAKHVPASDAPKIPNDKQVPANAHLGVFVSGGVSEGGGGGGGGKPRSLHPTIEDVKIYAQEIGLSAFEASKFFDHFEANGWRQKGGNPIKDWRAAARNWKRRAGGFDGPDAGGGLGAGKIAPLGGPAFDPSKPNAHTGGVRVHE